MAPESYCVSPDTLSSPANLSNTDPNNQTSLFTTLGQDTGTNIFSRSFICHFYIGVVCFFLFVSFLSILQFLLGIIFSLCILSCTVAEVIWLALHESRTQANSGKTLGSPSLCQPRLYRIPWWSGAIFTDNGAQRTEFALVAGWSGHIRPIPGQRVCAELPALPPLLASARGQRSPFSSVAPGVCQAQIRPQQKTKPCPQLCCLGVKGSAKGGRADTGDYSHQTAATHLPPHWAVVQVNQCLVPRECLHAQIRARQFQ